MIKKHCPTCKVLRNVVVSTIERDIEEKGDLFKVISKSYSCSMCNTFIRCENIKYIKPQKYKG